MILDSLLQFTGVSPATNIGNADGSDSPTTAAQSSTNQIDLHINGGLPVLVTGQGARDMGVGDDPALKMVVWVTTAFSAATNMSVALQGAPDNGAGTAGTFVTWWSSPTYTEATLIQGAMLYNMDLPRPPANTGLPRFLRLLYTTTGTHTAGALRGLVVVDRFDQPYQTSGFVGAYPAGITVAN